MKTKSIDLLDLKPEYVIFFLFYLNFISVVYTAWGEHIKNENKGLKGTLAQMVPYKLSSESEVNPMNGGPLIQQKSHRKVSGL